MKVLIAVVVSLLWMGCATSQPYQYIVSRDVPDKPSFVVIPASFYTEDTDLADKVEVSLMNLGVKVSARPSVKEVTEQKGAGLGAAQGEAGNARVHRAEASITEKYISFAELNSDYLVMVDGTTKRVKIIAKASKEVLASVVLRYTWSAIDRNRDKEIFNVLKTMGIGVRERVSP